MTMTDKYFLPWLCCFLIGLLAHSPQQLDALKLGVKGDDNKYCIVLDFLGITGSLQYMDKHGNITLTQFSVPSNNTSTEVIGKGDGTVSKPSECGVDIQRITIGFKPSIKDMEEDKRWYLSLEFNKTTSGENRYELTNYFLNVTFLEKHEAKFNYTYAKNGTVEWGAELKSAQSLHPDGFICSESKLPLSNDSSLSFDHFKIVAFYDFDKPDFRDGQVYEQCPLDVRTSDLIPIIVGALLAGLVIVVLISYLIGRARAKRQGYASV